MKIKSLHIYPVKALAGISVPSVYAEKEGFRNDRRYMLVDENSRFLSQREIPQLSLFKCAIANEGIEVEYNNDRVLIEENMHSNMHLETQIWNSRVKSVVVDQGINEWFSEHLGKNVRLVKMVNRKARYRRLFTAPFSTFVSYADGYPYLILSEASMHLLNAKMTTPLNINRFRANIIIESCAAHEEDNLLEFMAGKAKFKNIKKCARCIVTTVDQSTARKSAEPLKTLGTYRLQDNNIYFGSNLVCLDEGIVSCGDKLIQS